MTAITASAPETSKRAPDDRPHHHSRVMVELAGALECSPTHAERLVEIARRVNGNIVEACRNAQDAAYIDAFFASSDAARRIEGAPLRLDAHLLCHLAKDAAAEGVTITEFLAYNKSPEERAALLKQSRKLATDAAEVIAALEATV